ncbi:hypothetical protein SIM91_16645 [Rhodococcus opacus]|nr:hypothetical protein [Rhodococcus opacus]MDX5964928.1 hypothetical protein [Rhodococcus opacus]NKY74701.1 hypothetical protein [Rhodococcus opacus]UZG52440.1 hypothetical protein ONE62_19755 [Rhodococcus opacus]
MIGPSQGPFDQYVLAPVQALPTNLVDEGGGFVMYQRRQLSGSQPGAVRQHGVEEVVVDAVG